MKICFLVPDLNTKAGWGRMTFDLIEAIKGRNIETVVLSYNESLLAHPILNFFKIRKIFKQCDIIHAIEAWPIGFWANVINWGLKNKVIITAIGTYSVAPLYNLLSKWFLVWTYKKANAITAISDYTASEINKVLPDLNIGVIPPGFDLDFWSSGKTSGSEASKFKPYILSVGALKSRKGYFNSIKAFSVISKKIEKLNYVIVGQGEDSDYAKELKKIVKENNLENKVFFISSGINDKQLLGFYKNAEVFVLTPIEKFHHFEGFGIVYLEAAASGIPIIASKNSGAASAVSDGYNGILVLQNNPKAAASAILNILGNMGLKMKFGNNGREWVKEFSWEKIIKKYIEIYNTERD